MEYAYKWAVPNKGMCSDSKSLRLLVQVIRGVMGEIYSGGKLMRQNFKYDVFLSHNSEDKRDVLAVHRHRK